MDAKTLAKAMDNRVTAARYEELTPGWNNALILADCTTVNRVAMWCAQVGHESGGLKWMEEIASGDAYDTRTDLGNTPQVDGDGRLYKGRGPIQLTGKNNYRAFSQWARSKGLTDRDDLFVAEPWRVSEPYWGFLAATYYWTVARNMNRYADARDLDGATRAVNGGTNGLDDRRKFYDRALALGDALLPTEGVTVSYADDELSKKFPSRSKYRANDEPIDTLAGYVLFTDAAIHEMRTEQAALNGDPDALALVKREADKGDSVAKSVLAKAGK